MWPDWKIPIGELVQELIIDIEGDIARDGGTKFPPSHNTGLPASFAALTSPNPWSVTPFARGGKRRASPSGSATRGRYTQCPKTKAGFDFWVKLLVDRHPCTKLR